MPEDKQEKNAQLSVTITPEMRAALTALSASCGDVRLPRLVREITAAFLVANGYMRAEDNIDIEKGKPRAFFSADPAVREAAIAKMRERAANARASIDRAKPRAPYKKRHTPELKIMPAQTSETLAQFSRERIRRIVRSILAEAKNPSKRPKND